MKITNLVLFLAILQVSWGYFTAPSIPYSCTYANNCKVVRTLHNPYNYRRLHPDLDIGRKTVVSQPPMIRVWKQMMDKMIKEIIEESKAAGFYIILNKTENDFQCLTARIIECEFTQNY